MRKKIYETPLTEEYSQSLQESMMSEKVWTPYLEEGFIFEEDW